jgi:hypothetical protein
MSAALVAEDFTLLQLYADQFQPGEALAKVLKSARQKESRAAAKGSSQDGSKDASRLMTVQAASDLVMVAASAFGAQVYPDSRCLLPAIPGVLHYSKAYKKCCT